MFMHTRILLAGEKNLPQDIIFSYLENQEDYVLEQTENNGYLSRAILAKKPDILLLDLVNGDSSDVSSILWLRRTFPGLLIITLFIKLNKSILIELFKSGVFGYMLYKDLGELGDAIRAVNNHRLYLSRGLLQIMVDELSPEAAKEDGGFQLHPDRLTKLLENIQRSNGEPVGKDELKFGYYSDELDRIVHKWLLHNSATQA